MKKNKYKYFSVKFQFNNSGAAETVEIISDSAESAKRLIETKLHPAKVIKITASCLLPLLTL
jgi:hypothetical protein